MKLKHVIGGSWNKKYYWCRTKVVEVCTQARALHAPDLRQIDRIEAYALLALAFMYDHSLGHPWQKRVSQGGHPKQLTPRQIERAADYFLGRDSNG